MKQVRNIFWSAISVFILAACSTAENEKKIEPEGNDQKMTNLDPAKAVPDFAESPGKSRGPFYIDYEIIGKPVVGSSVTIELRLQSDTGPRLTRLDYRINDASSMRFSESQPASVQLEPAANESLIMQRVLIIPQREGRIYLNISASFESEEGTFSTVTAIPIHVGKVSTAPVEHGELQIDEDGQSVRVLDGES